MTRTCLDQGKRCSNLSHSRAKNDRKLTVMRDKSGWKLRSLNYNLGHVHGIVVHVEGYVYTESLRSHLHEIPFPLYDSNLTRAYLEL